MTTLKKPPAKLKRQDFVSDQEVRWCPGCGDYAILAQVQKALADIGLEREKHVFISGIGCSSRFPYYMETYGIHSIHGRAPTLATGLKCVNPDLSVWVITGDGDGLSIGGNHLIHAMRRNVNINIILFNNRIYGLTKGQYSPTSEMGKRTKSTPFGSIDHPFEPLSVAMAAETTFVARSIDRYTAHLQETIKAAHAHPGCSFVEVLQNCPIFNDGTHSFATDSDVKNENVVHLVDGEPMIFGNEKDKGVRLRGTELEVVDLKADPGAVDGLLVHQSTKADPTPAFLLSRMAHPEYPVPIGVFRNVERGVYDQMLVEKVQAAQEKKKDLAALLRGVETWTVE